MKPYAQYNVSSTRRDLRAMTLIELMVALAVFGLALVAMLYAHIFGLRQDQLVNSKLGASDESRRAFNQLADEIRSAKIWQVGSGDGSHFAAIANGSTQRGNALQLNLTTDTNSFVRYYFDAQKGRLYRKESDEDGLQVIARYLTNSMYFQAEDFLGHVKSDLSYKYVIRVKMEFYQYQYPLTKVGPDYYYDYYKMEFTVTPHCPDGA